VRRALAALLLILTTLVAVAALAMPEWLIEIEAVAVL